MRALHVLAVASVWGACAAAAGAGGGPPAPVTAAAGAGGGPPPAPGTAAAGAGGGPPPAPGTAAAGTGGGLPPEARRDIAQTSVQHEDITVHIRAPYNNCTQSGNTSVHLEEVIHRELSPLRESMRELRRALRRLEGGADRALTLLAQLNDNNTESEQGNTSGGLKQSIQRMINERGLNISTEISDIVRSAAGRAEILAAIGEIKQKLAVLDNISHLEPNTNKLTNSDKELETNNGTTEMDSNLYNFTLLCDSDALKTVLRTENSWKRWGELPETDDLDIFLANKTGCKYRTLDLMESLSASYSGAALARAGARGLQWRAALRMRPGTAVLNVYWGRRDGYSFYIDENYDVVMYEWPMYEEVARRRTAGLLSGARYTPLLLRLHTGCVSLAAGCDAAQPLFSRCGARPPALDVRVVLETDFANYRAKVLYDCPAL